MTASAQGFRNAHGIGARFDDVYLLAGARTPFGKFCGALSSVSPTDLGIHAARAAIAAAYASHKGSPLRLRAIAFAVGDTVSYIVGGYRYGDATEDMGKFTLTLRRTAGAPWLIASDMDSMNAPPPPRPRSE